jgi:hypothetical protein
MRYEVYEIRDGKVQQPPSVLDAVDAQSAAEDYVERAWWEAGRERPTRKVEVRGPDGVVSRWDVEGEASMIFHAEETS